MRTPKIVAAAAAVSIGLALGAPADAAVLSGGQPTKLAKLAKAMGIKKAGTPYTFDQEERSGDPIFLTVDVPTEWSDRDDSQFINPDTDEPYGAGVRATTDAEQFNTSYDVPGVKVTAAGLSADQVESFDARDLLANLDYEGCRKGKVKPFDNGTYEGGYQTFSRCDGTRAGVVALDVHGRGTELFVVAQVLSKADLAALDRVLSSAKIEKTST